MSYISKMDVFRDPIDRFLVNLFKDSEDKVKELPEDIFDAYKQHILDSSFKDLSIVDRASFTIPKITLAEKVTYLFFSIMMKYAAFKSYAFDLTEHLSSDLQDAFDARFNFTEDSFKTLQQGMGRLIQINFQTLERTLKKELKDPKKNESITPQLFKNENDLLKMLKSLDFSKDLGSKTIIYLYFHTCQKGFSKASSYIAKNITFSYVESGDSFKVTIPLAFNKPEIALEVFKSCNFNSEEIKEITTAAYFMRFEDFVVELFSPAFYSKVSSACFMNSLRIASKEGNVMFIDKFFKDPYSTCLSFKDINEIREIALKERHMNIVHIIDKWIPNDIRKR